MLVGKAHQRVIRERNALEGAASNLFGNWWASIDTSIANATVKAVSRKTAEKIILDYEWLGTMPAVVWYMFGIFWGTDCGGVVCYGPEYGENLGVWDKYGLTGRIICLSRGACVHWAHEHSASHLIMKSVKMLPKQFVAVTATTDYRAGEIGTIYQACGWGAYRMNTHSRSGALYNGKRMNSRGLRATFRKSTKEIIEASGGLVEREEAKLRYIYLRNVLPKMDKYRIQTALAPMQVAYPKRGDDARPPLR